MTLRAWSLAWVLALAGLVASCGGPGDFAPAAAPIAWGQHR